MTDKRALILEYFEKRDPAVKDQLVTAYKALVEYIARKLAFNRDDFDDVVQVGMMGLLRAIDHYSPAHEADFSTFATPNIIGEIKHYFRDKKNVVKIPRKLQENYSKVKQCIKDSQQSGKSITPSDIASQLGLTVEDVLEAMEASQSFSVISLDLPSHTKNDGSGASDTILDTLGGEENENQYLDSVTLGEAMKTLTSREKHIIHLRFYQGLSQKEIADAVGLSQMHVSRVLDGILKKLKKSFSN